MTIIDADWIAARLTRRGQQADLARAIGLTPQKMSAVMKGDRKLTQEEAVSTLRFFGETVINAPAAPGFAEPAAEPFTPLAESTEGLILARARRRLAHPYFYRLLRGESSLDLVAGDLLLVDGGREAMPGDLVICTISNPTLDTHQTQARRWFEPWLVAGDLSTQITDDGNASILGPIVGLIRGAVL